MTTNVSKLNLSTANEVNKYDFGVLNYLFDWIDRHEKLTNAIIAVEIIALVTAILFYNFTTNV